MILLAWLNDFILGSMRNVKKNVIKCICAAYVDSRKTNKMTFVPSLIRVFVVRSIGSLGPNFASGGQR